MVAGLSDLDLVIGICPSGEPNPALVAAVSRGGGLGVLHLASDVAVARRALADAERWAPGGFAVRPAATCALTPADLPTAVHTVVVDVADLPRLAAWTPEATGRRTLIEVTSPSEAAMAAVAGAAGLVARGFEAGGRVGSFTSFVLLQHLVAAADALPVWVAGGIGAHTAAAAVAGGAAGVVLDAQLALVAEVRLPYAIANAIRTADGTQTTVVDGHRVYARPDLPIAALAARGVVAALGTQDLHTQLLPIGQDAAFAEPLAKRHRSATGVVRAIREGVHDQIATAIATPPLAPGGGIARAGAFHYPVAQGPMTRVSDQAAFAAAVADGGGLPFVALALMTGEQTQRLLTETAERLGDRPWGVGILGFAPPELRAAQLTAVHAARPPYALIAGGRPDQAAPLDAAGTTTFLHVPSPGLLEQFLAQGARRFVFEGLECGGHVGPRASFPLWEMQVQRLLDLADEDLAEVHVLFAGGIHDERSAAMVAALAAPLAARGAAVGVLMGTAYLFTEEAVAAGAVVEQFQRVAVECTDTVLLETSPGHATRCARTGYVDTFALARQRLAETGVSTQDAWAELEQLNLGRLRVASKGLRREGDRLNDVDADTQLSDGMYMIGQVATLRSATTTIAALHRQVTDGATAFLAERATALGGRAAAGVQVSEPAPLDIAIVGMASILPQAPDIARYWRNIVAAVNAITEVPTERWAADTYFDADAYANQSRDAVPSKWGGFLPRIPFDPLAYGIPPASLASIEPVQLLALEVAARALADAGYADRPFDRERASVIFGAEAGHDLATAYGFRALAPSYFGELPAELDEQLPRFTEDTFPGALANVIAGRIANRLDLGGTNFTVDAACAAALAALNAAAKELRAGTSDLVLCGAADLHNGINDYLMFGSVRALSPSGRCATFGANADGIALGEGVACVVLKRLADAERDGDRIYAVLKAVAGSSDGRSLGLTAPRPEGQRRALERAYAAAGISPADVGLVEAHGTGTVIGDRTELATLTEVFSAAGAAPGSSSLGSVKSQIGHTKCAAGLAGLIKAAYAVHTGVRPPTLHLDPPNPYWDADGSPFAFDRTARPWLTPAARRIAGVSAFGFGGTNFHVVIAGYDGAAEPTQAMDDWPAELFCIRGADRSAATRQLDRLAELVAANDRAGRPWRLRDLAWTLAANAPARTGVQVAFVATDLDDLADKLAAARTLRTDRRSGVFAASEGTAGEAGPGRVAFLFPGQGSQRPGMLGDLFVAFPPLRELLTGAAARYADVMFPPTAFDATAERRQLDAITDTRVAQPTLGVAGLAAYQLLTSLGVRPDLAGGHSYGELVALCAAGVVEPAALIELSAARAAAILASAGDDPGTMAAVAATPDEVRAVIAEHPDVVIANHNAPTQAVISGPTAAVDAALAALKERGVAGKRVPVACAFHSPVVAGAADTFAATLAGRELAAPAFEVWGNTAAAPYPADADGIRATLAGQLAAPVRFVEQIEAMYAAGARTFVEAGPGTVLTRLVGAILGDRPHTVVAIDLPGQAGLPRLLHALAELAAAGVPVDVEPLFAGRDAAVVSAAAVPQRPGWTVDGHLVRTAVGELLPGGLRPATVIAGITSPPVAPAGDRDLAVLEYLRTSRELIAAQRDVVLGYLGAGHPVNGAPLGYAAAASPAAAVVLPDPAVSPALLPAAAQASPSPAGPPVADPTGGAAAPELNVLDVVVSTVSARTGYPPEMLDPSLDLEADLSIDSIKRTELIGELTQRLGFAGESGVVGDAVVEELSRVKTINGIVAWITERTSAAPATAESTASAADDTAGPAEPVPVGAAPWLRRFAVAVEQLPPAAEPPAGALTGRTVAVVDDGSGVALELIDLLHEYGAQARIHVADDPPAHVLVHLGAIAAERPVLPGGFEVLRRAVLDGVRSLVVTTGSAGTFGHGWGGEPPTDPTAGAGLRGLVRSIAHELPGVAIRMVDVDRKEAPRKIARHLLAEICNPDAPTAVGYTNGTRTGLRVVADDAPVQPGDLGLACRAAGIDRDSVVLLTGGARGITASVAVALAEASGCHVTLVGRTPAPAGDLDPELLAAADEPTVRRLLAARGVRNPAEVGQRARQLLADREIRATLDRLSRSAASVRYAALDVRDGGAVSDLVADVRARHGRLDAIIHGAGINDDRLLVDKTPEAFARVWSTKVDGARALAAAAPPGLRYLVLFGSVAGVFGNRGQADYAAANDALDTLAWTWRGRVAHRVLAVDWGPWSPAAGGMVTPELAREYARRGIGMIEPAHGVAALLDELAWGSADQCQVGFLNAPLDAFDPAGPR